MRLFSILFLLFFVVISVGCARKQSDKPSYKGKSLAYWASQAENEKAATRREAATALGKCGPDALPALMKLVNDKNHRVRAHAVLAINEIGSKGVPKLKELIHDQDKNIQKAAIDSLIQQLLNMREKGARQIVKLLEDEDPTVRFYASKAFIRMDRKLAKQSIPELKKLLEDPNEKVRQAASLSLSIIQPIKPKFSPPGRSVKIQKQPPISSR